MNIHFGSAREQQLRYFGGIGNGRTVQGGITRIGTLVRRRVHQGAMRQEKACDGDLILLGCIVQQRLIGAWAVIDIDARRGKISLQLLDRPTLHKIQQVSRRRGTFRPLQDWLRGNDRHWQNHVGQTEWASALIADFDHF
ncbi:MAG TPA: hypothetical protein VGD63_09180 [Steroidobacteraceae bacterium]